MKRNRLALLLSLPITVCTATGCHSASDQIDVDANQIDSGSNDAGATVDAPLDGSVVVGHGVSGASQAVCNPAPCGAPVTTTYTLPNVSNDDGTASSRAYQLVVPANLNPSASNR